MTKTDSAAVVLALLKIKGKGPKYVVDVVKKCNYDPEYLLDNISNFLSTGDIAAFDDNLAAAETEITENKKAGIDVISIFDERFPRKLCPETHLRDSCVYLYYRGDLTLMNEPSVAVIGTRGISDSFLDKGREYTARLSKELVIVSGLALGSDTVAHTSCIDAGGRTVAVLPSAIDDPYPSQNRALAERIVENGGLLVSEYGTGSKMSKYNYPQRDRIQSLLSDKVLIIQSTDDGGSMIAARMSLGDGKCVRAIEGNDLKDVGNIDIDDLEGTFFGSDAPKKKGQQTLF